MDSGDGFAGRKPSGHGGVVFGGSEGSPTEAGGDGKSETEAVRGPACEAHNGKTPVQAIDVKPSFSLAAGSQRVRMPVSCEAGGDSVPHSAGGSGERGMAMKRLETHLCGKCGLCRKQGRTWVSDTAPCVVGGVHVWITRAELLKRRVPKDTPEGMWSAAEAYQLIPGKMYRVESVFARRGVYYKLRNELLQMVEVGLMHFSEQVEMPGDWARFQWPNLPVAE